MFARKAVNFIKSVLGDSGASNPLFEELKTDCPDRIEKLLKNDPALARGVNSFGNTPLHIASAGGFVNSARILIESGAPIDAENRMKWTPLHCASAGGNHQLAALLLKHGASVDPADDSGKTPLHRAAENGHEETAGILIKNGADVLARSKKGNTPLSLAKAGNHLATSELIKKYRPKHAL